MKLKKNYINTRDLDWFACVNGVYIHVASAGGELPDLVNDIERLRAIQQEVSERPNVYEENEIDLNEQFIKEKLQENVRRLKEYGLENVAYDEDEDFQDYITTFAAMARKGFYSFDRTNVTDPTDNQYHLVAYPKQLGGVNNLNIPHLLSVKTNITEIFAMTLRTQRMWNLIDLMNKSERV